MRTPCRGRTKSFVFVLFFKLGLLQPLQDCALCVLHFILFSFALKLTALACRLCWPASPSHHWCGHQGLLSTTRGGHRYTCCLIGAAPNPLTNHLKPAGGCSPLNCSPLYVFFWLVFAALLACLSSLCLLL